eukprot:2889836-Amphidinium_carterae.1
MNNYKQLLLTIAIKSYPGTVPQSLSLRASAQIGLLEYRVGLGLMHEHPFNVFLVDEGVFAHVGKVSSHGGCDGAPKASAAHSNM